MFVISTFAACDTKEILKRMQKHSKSLKSLRADVTMDGFDSQLGVHDIYKGEFIFVPKNGQNDLIRIDRKNPKESLAVVNKKYILFRPNLNQAFVGKIDRPQIFEMVSEALAFMNVSKEHFKATYNLKYLGEEKISSGVATQHLEFTPKVAKNYKTAECWVDNDGMPIQMKVTLNNNDSITVLFTNIQKNIFINENEFKILLPKNTKIING